MFAALEVRVERRPTPQTPVTANSPVIARSRWEILSSHGTSLEPTVDSYLSIDNSYVPKWTAPRR